MIFTKEQMSVLDGYQHTFTTAVKSSYARNLGSKHYEILNEIYEQAIGKENKVNFSCPHCCLQFIQQLGNLYFKDKEAVQEETEPNNKTSKADALVKAREARAKKRATNK